MICLIPGVVAGTVIPPSSLLNGLVAYWRMDESSGNAADATGNGFTATNVGTVTYTTGKINNGALLSDTGPKYFDLGSSSSLNPPAFSFAAWVNFSTLVNSNGLANAIHFREVDGTHFNFLYVRPSGLLACYVYGNGSVSYDETGSHALSLNQWHHLVMTYDSVSGLVGYVNGAVDGTAAANGPIAAIAANSYIGHNNLSSGREPNAIIDEAGIWSRAITSAEVTALYNFGLGTTYPFLAIQGPNVNIKTHFKAVGDGTTDDSGAFVSFNAWANNWQQAHPGLITLTIPSSTGAYEFKSGGTGTYIAKGIKNLLVVGTGSAALSDNGGAGNGFFLGGQGQIGDNLHSARVATVSAGASSVTLNTHAQTSLFTVGQYALLTGIDLQGYGGPTNPQFFEYLKVASINAGTGVVGFTTPLVNSYKSTWPLYNAGDGTNFDQGGPATLYALDPSWDAEVEYRNLTIDQSSQTYSQGRKVTYTNCVFTGSNGPIPTQNLLWTATGCTATNCDMEIDKLNDTIVISGSTWRQLIFQSGSNNNLTMDSSTVNNTMNGHPKTATITNSTIASLGPGAIAYGVSSEIECDNCTISAITAGGFQQTNLVALGATMSGGVITINNSGEPVAWAVPGAKLFFGGTYRYSFPFTVLDVSKSGSNTLITTDQAGGFPTIPGGVGEVDTHPAPACTFSNCIGSSNAINFSQATAGNPLYTYSKLTYTGNIGSAPGIGIIGKLVSLKINVTTPYTGIHSPLSLEVMKEGANTIKPDVTYFAYDPFINLSVAGLRTITPSGVTGTQSGDSGLSAPGAIWFAGGGTLGPYLATDISGESSSVWPTFSIELITDQS
jgi:hypothetical protein